MPNKKIIIFPALVFSLLAVFSFAQFVKVAQAAPNFSAGMTISSGNVGIGTINPIGKLNLRHTVSPTTITNDNSLIYLNGTSAANSYRIISFGYAGVYPLAYMGYLQTDPITSYGFGDLVFGTKNSSSNDSDVAPSERLRITSDGYVGIGTAAPTSQLHLEKTYGADSIAQTSNIGFSTNNGAGTSWYSGKITGYLNANAGTNGGYPGGLAFQTKNADSNSSSIPTTKMVIDSTGNVGIGTTNPLDLLSIGVQPTTGSTIGTGHNSSSGYLSTDTYALANIGYVKSFFEGNNHPPVSLAVIGSAPNANGATITAGQVLNLEPANASFGGVVSTIAQTLAGAKTFTGTATFNNATYSAFFTGGNVGVGTATPIGRLNINQDDTIDKASGSNIGSINLTHPTSGGMSAITFKSTINWPSDGGYLAYYDTNPTYAYWGVGTENSALVLGTTNDGKTSASDVVVLKSQAAAIIDAPSLLIPSGYVGISTTNPLDLLSIGVQPTTGSALGTGHNSTNTYIVADTYALANIGYVKSSMDIIVPGGPGALWSGIKDNNIWNGTAGAGNVGVGTTAPLAKLHVAGGPISIDSGQQLNFRSDQSGGGYWIGYPTGGLNTYINVANDAATKRAIAFTTSSNNTISGTVTAGITIEPISDMIYFGSAKDTNLYRNAANILRTGDSLIVDGSVGIGTTGPSAYFHGGTNKVLEIQNSATAANSQAQLILSTGATANLGGVGTLTWIASNASTNKGIAYIAGLVTADSSVSGVGAIAFSTADSAVPAERMRITNKGNLGIGTIAPLDLLSIGVQPTTGSALGTGHNSTPTYISTDTYALANIGYVQSAVSTKWTKGGDALGSDAIWLGSSDNFDVSFRTNNAERIRILKGGNVGINITTPSTRLQIYSDNVPEIASANPLGAFSIKSSASTAMVMGVDPASPYEGWIQVRHGTVAGGNYYPLSLQPLGGNVGIGIANPSALLYVDGTMTVAGVSTFTGSANFNGGATINGDLTMTGTGVGYRDIHAVRKITAEVVDPLYNIKGTNYSTYAAAVAGGLKEEYIGRISASYFSKKNGYFETTIDLAKEKEGSDLWVWYHVVEFNDQNVEIFLTPRNSFASVYSLISGSKIIIRSDHPADMSMRLVGSRFDWRKWPTKPLDQTEKSTLIIK